MSEIQITLEHECPACYGDGRSRWNKGEPCTECYGTGMMPSELGDAIRKLVKRHLPQILKEIEEESRADDA